MGGKIRPSARTRTHEGSEVTQKPPNSKSNKNNSKSKPKAQPKPQVKPQPQSATAPALPVAHQQHLLHIFSTAFSSVLGSETFSSTLQEIKSALYERDFVKAFGKEEFLEAYAARWSPTRAVCYAAVLEGLKDEIQSVGIKDEVEEVAEGEAEKRKTLKMIAIGGCAAEHVAFSSFLSRQSLTGNLTLLDSAPWSSVVNLTQDAINIPPPISEYASEENKGANTPLVEPSQLSLDFKQTDVLELDKDQLREHIGEQKCLVSVLFTLNELYTNGGLGKTTKFLKNLGEVLADGSLLLVLDSPGSYSETAVGKEQKKYPMQWLMDHTLQTRSEGCRWENLQSDDSVWFRLPDGIKYPIQLENMRYQMHLYRIERKSESKE